MVFIGITTYLARWLGRMALPAFALLALAACSDANVKVSMLSSTLGGIVAVSISSNAGTNTNQNAIPIQIQFSEDIQGLSLSDFEVTNGTLSSLTGSASTYTAIVTPTSNGPISIKLKSSEVSVPKNLPGQSPGGSTFKKKASGDALGITFDNVPPTVQMRVVGNTLTNQTTSIVSLVFSEDVEGLSLSDFTVSNSGSVTAITGSGKSYSVSLLTAAAGTYELTLLPNSVKDKGGNDLVQGANVSVTYDPTVPVPALSSSTSSVTNSSAISVIINFNGINVTGLELSDFTATNAVISGLSGAGSVYSVTLTPSSDGVASLVLNAGKVTNAAGTVNVVSNTLSFNVDRIAPVINLGAANTSLGSASTKFTWPLTYSDAAVVTLNSANIVLTGATTNCVTEIIPQNALSYVVSVSGCSGNGNLTMSVVSGTASDAAGNMAPAAGPTNAVTLNNTVFTASFTKSNDVVNEGNAANTQSFTVTLDQVPTIDVTLKYAVLSPQTTALTTDFNLTNGTLVIPANQQTATISYQYNGNNIVDGSKVIQVGLIGGVSASGKAVNYGTQSWRRLVQDDDQATSFVKVATALNHSCGILSGGILKCWGGNENGQIGDGTTTRRLLPTIVDSGVTYSDISTGGNHSCGITTSGILKCWGYNYYGQLGDGTSLNKRVSPVVIDSGTLYSEVSVGSSHTCAVTTVGVLKCWGLNSSGQLGNGTKVDATSPTIIESGVFYGHVGSGNSHSCGITTLGVLKCWGNNIYGQLGDGTTTDRLIPTIIDSGTVTRVVASTQNTCSINSSGILKCWGANGYGQLGDGTTTNKASPTVVDSANSYTSVSSGWAHVCGVTTPGEIKCWGFNSYGQLGLGHTVNKTTPSSVESGTAYSFVSGREYHSCGITNSGVLKCWGFNSFGQLGDGNELRKLTPAVVDMVSTYSLVKAYNHTCAISSIGALKCWGDNSYNQIADGSTSPRTSPVVVEEGVTYNQIATSVSQTCGITNKGVLKCRGTNMLGSMGLGSSVSSTRYPVSVVDPGVSYDQLTMGLYHVCGITSAGVLKCWGANSSGQVGNGTNTDQNLPVVIDSGVSYSKISAGSVHTCGITTSGILKCWGSNLTGRLGDGTAVDRNLPVVIDSGVSYSFIGNGIAHSCAITTGNVLKCWGNNSYSQLGNGGTTELLVPTVIDTGVSYGSVFGGSSMTCAITTAGALKCWGTPNEGAIGDGSTGVRNTPTIVDSGTAYMNAAISTSFACGITSAGVLKCWGLDSKGQLGMGNSSYFPAPVAPN
ncbi:Ig-like domain-containing protein [Bdellovibrio sp. SKB1291214]|uniref:Ig-like domain-containing protein n=1 Tax=Bdellovibrio sp. SKB1291214 TaxID=1732569 RepID=UPI000B516C04|nr:Ig-like domain-containing protein [Bdellovibrio sp. SKB1291214]UYL10322.1 Ig-like domain-containing protein [Bdellovibrio sp. SKB1291214]